MFINNNIQLTLIKI